MVGRIDGRALKASLHDGGEIALLDAREEVPFDARHLLMAACGPLSRLELLLDEMVPRRSARVVWCDDGEGLSPADAQLRYSQWPLTSEYDRESFHQPPVRRHRASSSSWV